MDRIKIYSGMITEDSATKSVKMYYGATSNTLVKKGKTEMLNGKLLEFLNDCGGEAEYDGNFLWINGVPVTLLFTGTNSFFAGYYPFNSNMQYGSDSSTNIFNGLNYNFKVRLLGEPTTAFFLLISTNYASPAFNQNGFVMVFYKAENILNGREARLYGKSFSGNHLLGAFDLDDDGLPTDIGRGDTRSTSYKLYTYAQDFEKNRDKYPLVEWMPDIFKVSGCYYNLQVDPLPQGANIVSDAQVFLKIGENICYRPQYGPFIKCVI